MKKIIVLIALLVAAQAQAEMSDSTKKLLAKSVVMLCEAVDNSDYELRDLKSTADNCSPGYSCSKIKDYYVKNRPSVDAGIEDCNNQISEQIKLAASGDDAIYDGLMDGIDIYAGGNRRQMVFADKYRSRLQMAQQRALLKAKQK